MDEPYPQTIPPNHTAESYRHTIQRPFLDCYYYYYYYYYHHIRSIPDAGNFPWAQGGTGPVKPRLYQGPIPGRCAGYVRTIPPEPYNGSQTNSGLKGTDLSGNSHMGVSENRGTPKSSIFIGFSILGYP